MNKNNIINREYTTNENILKKVTSNNKNIYSSYFNLDKKASPSLNFNIKPTKGNKKL